MDFEGLELFVSVDISKQLWDSMKVKYQGNARVKGTHLQMLRRSFELLEMKGGETVNDYFASVMSVANDMRNCGEEMQDVKIVDGKFQLHSLFYRGIQKY